MAIQYVTQQTFYVYRLAERANGLYLILIPKLKQQQIKTDFSWGFPALLPFTRSNTEISRMPVNQA